jgi:hypothetical protein
MNGVRHEHNVIVARQGNFENVAFQQTSGGGDARGVLQLLKTPLASMIGLTVV